MEPRLDTTEIETADGHDASVASGGRSTDRLRSRSALRPGPHFASGLVVILGAALSIAVLMSPSQMAAANSASPSSQSQAGSESAEALYVEHCGACHQPTGLGIVGTFPPLAANPAAADPAYVETVIVDGLSGPLDVLGVTYDQEMPAVAALSDPDEIAQVVDFVVALAGDDGTTSTDQADEDENAAPAEPVVGDAARGRELFVGSERFDGGAVACVACHEAGSVGNLSGASLGPDLTMSFDTFGGEAGLSGWLANPPSETMQPIFADRELTEAELADVVAFLGDAPSQDPPTGGIDRLSLAGVAGVLVLFGGMAVAWRGMRQTYAERLRRSAGAASLRVGPSAQHRRRRGVPWSSIRPSALRSRR